MTLFQRGLTWASKSKKHCICYDTAMPIKEKSDKKTVFVAVVLGVLIVLASAYIFRGWIRDDFLPNQVSYLAKRSLVDSYKASYKSAEQTIQDLQLNLSPDAGASCSLLSAEGIQTTLYCNAGSEGTTEASDDYIKSFKQNSSEVEARLLSNGWTKTWNAQQPINELFNNPENDVSIGVNYEKRYGKNLCRLSLYYNAYEKNPSMLRSSLGCTRTVHYF